MPVLNHQIKSTRKSYFYRYQSWEKNKNKWKSAGSSSHNNSTGEVIPVEYNLLREQETNGFYFAIGSKHSKGILLHFAKLRE